MSGKENRRCTPLTRRYILHSGVIGAVALAGCLEDDPTVAGVDQDTTTTPATPEDTDEKTATQTPTDTDETTANEEGEESTPTDDEDVDEETSRNDWGATWHIQPDTWSSSTPEALDCDDEGVQRYSQGFEDSNMVWGDGVNWEMRIDKTSMNHGATARIQLMNVTDEEQERGANSKYNLQVETDAGWEDVRVYESKEDRGPHPAIIRVTDAGDSHEWELTMDEEAIAGTVCPSLQSGRYRFVYWGFLNADDDAVGVGFNFSP